MALDKSTGSRSTPTFSSPPGKSRQESRKKELALIRAYQSGNFDRPKSQPPKFMRDIVNTAKALVDPRPVISDAYWSITHPRDRVIGRGRAANPIMGVPIGGKFGARTPGLRLERATAGDRIKTYEGQTTTLRGPMTAVERAMRDAIEARRDMASDMVMPMNVHMGQGWRHYNLLNDADDVVGTVSSARKGKSSYINEIWVDPPYRRTGALYDLLRAATSGGKRDIRGDIASLDPRVKKLYDRYRQRLKEERLREWWASPAQERRAPPGRNPALESRVDEIMADRRRNTRWHPTHGWIYRGHPDF